QSKRAVIVFAVVHVAKVDLVLAGEEEFVRRRKDGKRAMASFENLKPIARTQIYIVLIGCAAKRILLPGTRSIAPHQLRRVADMETVEPGFVNKRDGRLFCFRDRLLRHRLVPLYTVKRRSPAKAPSVSPLKVTLNWLPSVARLHVFELKLEL